MKLKDIKRHLKPYSIYGRRKSTISHAFASALSVTDPFDQKKVEDGIKILGQDPNSDLMCAYCDKPAKTWDHIKPVVKGGSFSGHGHQINNLIPCCKDCNSAKGNKEWNEFLTLNNLDTTLRKERITNYISHNWIDQTHLPENEEIKPLLDQLDTIKEQIFEGMKRADILAKEIRQKMSESKRA